MNMVVDKLKGAGHTVLPWEPYKHTFAWDLANRAYASDGGEASQHHLLRELFF